MSRIESTGSYLPEKVITNDYFADRPALFGSIEEYFTGYEERRHADKSEETISMAEKAAMSALSNSTYQADDIDSIIGCLLPSGHLYGDDLNLLQHAIGARNASVLPINTTCSSFLSALNLADSLIASGKKNCVLIVVAVNWINHGLDTTKANFAFAGDGAAAVILDNKSDHPSLIGIHEINNSPPAVFSSMAMKNPLITGKKEYFEIIEPEGVSTAKDLILFPINVAKQLLTRHKDVKVDKIFMHQSGLKMMQMWLDKLGLPFDSVRHTLNLYANMTAANIPVSLDHWINKGDLERGETILFFAPAAGGHYIAMLWRY